MKIMIMAGTRPEAIKLAPVIHALRKFPKVEITLCNTGQHKEMIEQALNDFEIKADICLNVMNKNQSLASLSSSLFTNVDLVFARENPNWVMVQGDTTTVMVSALCAFYRNIKIAHVEAGLRSHNKNEPFPEEVNRVIVSKVADLHFAPTKIAYDNLIQEGIDAEKVLVTGNTVIDALLWTQRRIKTQNDLLDPQIYQALCEGKKIILVTGHRRENLGPKFVEMCQAIRELADLHKNVFFVYPVHLNPRVRETVFSILKGHSQIFLCPPLSYRRFIALLNKSYIVLTDSGGIQEEAPALGKPVLVMRDVTERPEGIQAGASRLVGTDKAEIVKQVSNLIINQSDWNKMANAKNPYGDGKAARYIAEFLVKNGE